MPWARSDSWALDGKTTSLESCGQLVFRIKAQKRVQYCKRTIGHAEQRLGLAQRTIQFPFVDRLVLFDIAAMLPGLPTCQASSAAAQKASSHFHSPFSFTFLQAKEIRSPKRCQRLLTAIRGNAILDLA